jgi:hypothetical protein
MGKLVYSGAQFEVEIEDRTLAHLQAVIGAKLRRGESFYFNWTTNDPELRRNTLWLNPSIAVRYHYADSGRPTINRDWLETLTVSVSSPSGLSVIPEPGVA